MIVFQRDFSASGEDGQAVKPVSGRGNAVVNVDQPEGRVRIIGQEGKVPGCRPKLLLRFLPQRKQGCDSGLLRLPLGKVLFRGQAIAVRKNFLQAGRDIETGLLAVFLDERGQLGCEGVLLLDGPRAERGAAIISIVVGY